MLLFTFSFSNRRQKEKVESKKKTRMIKWIESLGASPPNPHLEQKERM